ncbi:MAG: hypothetical protein ACP5P4_16270 [Steroidobacteraceae bacterium]
MRAVLWMDPCEQHIDGGAHVEVRGFERGDLVLDPAHPALGEVELPAGDAGGLGGEREQVLAVLQFLVELL